MILGIPREFVPGERRVALVPPGVAALVKLPGVEVLMERGAGDAAGFPDAEYEKRGAKLAPGRDELFRESEVIAQVWCPCAKPEAARDASRLRDRLILIGHCDPLAPEKREHVERMAATGAAALAMELMPRITRAQSMDALSSQATIAGYKAVILAAERLPKMFPMMMTAAGTIAAAKVLVIGAGVAGLQAIATARRLGAIVSAYDVRPAVKEQVQSLGARFIELELETEAAEGKGGYAKAMDEAFYARQRERLGKVIAECDIVITTAAVPGRKSPVLVTREMVKRMNPGSVIVDLAAERGGNCELTRADEVVRHSLSGEATDAAAETGQPRADSGQRTAGGGSVVILGPTNLPATVPLHASQMYSRNIEAFLKHLIKDGRIDLERDDEILRETLLSRGGEVVHPRLREAAVAGT